MISIFLAGQRLEPVTVLIHSYSPEIKAWAKRNTSPLNVGPYHLSSTIRVSLESGSSQSLTSEILYALSAQVAL